MSDFSKSILIFTNSYPYGTGETFFKDELSFLSTEFKTVYVQPLAGSGIPGQSVPDGVVVLKPVFKKMSYLRLIVQGLLQFGPLGRLSKVFNKDFIQSLGQYAVARALYCNREISDLIRNVPVKYFYWGKGAASVCIFFNIPGKKNVRFHGYDLYESDVRKGNVIPLRHDLLQRIDKAIFISQDGLDYISKKYHSNGEVHRLGIQYNGLNPDSSNDEFTILSCSSLFPVKRIDLLVRALMNVKSKIHWIHIGDGSEKEKVLRLIEKLPNNVRVSLLGHIDNGEVIKFYQTHHVDLLVNVSESEGIPFSMMEAISFGVPVLGTDVGGVKEIVMKESGYLISAQDGPERIGMKIEQIITSQSAAILRNSSNELYWSKFSASKNYKKLALALKG